MTNSSYGLIFVKIWAKYKRIFEERLALVERRRNEEEKMMREATSKRIMAEAKVNVSKNNNFQSRRKPPNLAIISIPNPSHDSLVCIEF